MEKEKEKEYTAPIIHQTLNPSTQDISTFYYGNFENYMHGYYGPMPQAWLPAVIPHPIASVFPSDNENVVYPFQYSLTTSSVSESKVVKVQPIVEEISSPSTSECRDVEDQPIVEEISIPSTSDVHNQEITDIGIEEPKSGMLFKSLEEVLAYYKQYAKSIGFGVTIQRSEKGEDGNVRYATIGCARGGKPRNRKSPVGRPRPTGKTGCTAKIYASKKDGIFMITTARNSHNHDLSPHKSRFYRCNRQINDHVKRVLDTNDRAGIRINKSFNSIVIENGGYENVPFLEKDCRNWVDKARQLRLGKGGAGALRDYFIRMQLKNDGFFAVMDVDDDGRLLNVFWADARSRASYKYFGDVITFDSTYLTNRFGMPFTPFVGVNHHGQSILLGAGLISSEDTKTYTWLFRTWLQCMDGKAPKAIITDQDRAMFNAIKEVFPNTRHRFCLWHILKKCSDKLHNYGEYKNGIKTQLMRCVYDTHTIEQFETSWDEMLNQYNLHDNSWLKNLYSDREYWVPIFLKEYFWAGMSTTQRSEGMNAFFDGYVHSKTNLKEFVDQYDNALKRKVENEISADFQSFNGVIPCVSKSPIEKKFQSLYTNAKFREVQVQVMGIIDVDPVHKKKEGVISTYQVEDENQNEVLFNEAECEARCSCGLFQMRGILCCHILAVFKSNKISTLPERYILDRWRKDIKRRYTLISSSCDVPEDRPAAHRRKRLLNICNELITQVVSSDHNTEDAVNKLHDLIEFYRKNITPCPPQPCPAICDAGSSKAVLTPKVVRGKGRPQSLRMKSRMEKSKRKKTATTKRRQPHGGDTQVLETCRNLFNPSTIWTSDDGHVQMGIGGEQVGLELQQPGLEGEQIAGLEGAEHGLKGAEHGLEGVGHYCSGMGQ